MLWLAADLPGLSLEALGDSVAETAVTASRGARRWIIAARDPKLSLGMELGQARSLRPGLQAHERQPGREAAALEALACAVYTCGDRIHWRTQEPAQDYALPRHLLWIEIGASLRLLGGLEGACRAVAAEIAALGHSASLGIAPTIEAAAVFARTGTAPVSRVDELHEALAPLPVAALNLPHDVLELLQHSGVHRIGELLALPRAEFGDRAGTGALVYLERLLGLRADSRRGYQPPSRFQRRVDFVEDLEHVEALAFPLRRLVGEFARYLRARATGAQQFRLELQHARRPADERAPTRIDVVLSSPSRDEALLERVLRERLGTLSLPAPANALSLQAERFAEPPVAQHDLFDTRPHTEEQIGEVVDRLTARLGGQAVWRPQLVEDHRPEHAWRAAPLSGSGDTAAAPPAPRPAWLLREPRKLHRPPRALGYPECIESGWWDGDDVRRNYYRCLLDHGVTGWVYEDRNTGDQVLQGVWG